MDFHLSIFMLDGKFKILKRWLIWRIDFCCWCCLHEYWLLDKYIKINKKEQIEKHIKFMQLRILWDLVSILIENDEHVALKCNIYFMITLSTREMKTD